MVMNVAGVLNAYHQTAKGGMISDSSDVQGAGNFLGTLQGFLGDSIGTLKQGEKAAAEGATGKADMQSVVMAVDKASTTLETVIALRDKIVSAYEEVLRMTI